MTENFNLCLDVLRKLHKAKVLDKVTVIGSWALFFYVNFFKDSNFKPTLRTRDIDFLIPIPVPKWDKKVDLPSLLEELGFAVVHNYSSGVMTLSHPQLIVEFLVPELGRGTDKPLKLPELKINAQRIRFLNYLLEETVKIQYEDVCLYLPQPARFAFHKLIVASRRRNKEKSLRDIEHANILFEYLIKNNKRKMLQNAFKAMPEKWANSIKKKIYSTENVPPHIATQLVNILEV